MQVFFNGLWEAAFYIPAAISVLVVRNLAMAFFVRRSDLHEAHFFEGATLNPLVRMDRVGFFFLAVGGAGWSKDPSPELERLRLSTRTIRRVIAAGPWLNLLAAGALAAMAILFRPEPASYTARLLQAGAFMNIHMAILGMIPFPPFAYGRLMRGLEPGWARHEVAGLTAVGIFFLFGAARLFEPLDALLGAAMFPIPSV